MENRSEIKKENAGGAKRGRRMIDLSGKKYGRLSVLFPTEKRNSNGSIYWHCRCECGQELDVPAESLMYGNSKSCGCLKQQMRKNMNDQFHRIGGTCLEWLEKRKGRSDNTSGYKGVSRLKNGKYRVNIGFQGKHFYLGTFINLEDAIAVRRRAEDEIHGRFIKSYYIWKKKADEDPEWGQKNPLKFEVERGADGAFYILSDVSGENEEISI
ncbi:MAG: hypothetical protein IJ390_04550 [Lachnospiraceae bacterium]|nr:hypothetical protein [Lachnospiraceae bacterium]